MKSGVIQAQKEALSVRLLTGEHAFHKFTDPDFLANWDALYESCPWATIFQSREYVTNWFNVYQQLFPPVFVVAEVSGQWIGLFPLTIYNNLLVGAGHFNAEYQTWLALPSHNEQFVRLALQELKKSYPKLNLELKYVPKETPLHWLSADKNWKSKCVIGRRTCPLMRIANDNSADELTSRHMRKKINRLKRLGNLVFERVLDRDYFCSIFDEIALQYDFRQAARFNKDRASQRAFRKAFLLALFDAHLLHVTILKLDNKVIASTIGVADRDCLYLKGMKTYAPGFAKYSPTILHFLLLTQHLNKERVKVFDLTPGDEPYKDRLATDHDQIYELMIANSNWYLLKNKIRKSLFRLFAQNKIKPNLLKEYLVKKRYFLLESIRKVSKGGIYTSNRDHAKAVTTLIFNDKSLLQKSSNALTVHEDSLEDLLLFAQSDTHLSKWGFLESAMKKLEAEQHCYTLIQGDILLGCVWLRVAEERHVIPSNNSNEVLSESALLLNDLYWKVENAGHLNSFIITVVDTILQKYRGFALFAEVKGLYKNHLTNYKAAGFIEYDKVTMPGA